MATSSGSLDFQKRTVVTTPARKSSITEVARPDAPEPEIVTLAKAIFEAEEREGDEDDKFRPPMQPTDIRFFVIEPSGCGACIDETVLNDNLEVIFDMDYAIAKLHKYLRKALRGIDSEWKKLIPELDKVEASETALMAVVVQWWWKRLPFLKEKTGTIEFQHGVKTLARPLAYAYVERRICNQMNKRSTVFRKEEPWTDALIHNPSDYAEVRRYAAGYQPSANDKVERNRMISPDDVARALEIYEMDCESGQETDEVGNIPGVAVVPT
ncbi:hypothetical protein BJ508DRAFT_331044 [Ascobolus immersus RN42]|uniref:Uncharacterized protein n=1 Tax=Ascobolus immersus RN42 TaxID=1160509 RepID=A0A3N4HRM4_ASCIM|nr:hypothetical protein BJ508DRAFT_331044 [Ascobolus immersus RN42]